MNPYEQLVTKQSELASLIAKIADEDRKPTEEEKTQLKTLRVEIDAIKASWESDGRQRFLEGLQTKQAPKGGPVVLKSADFFVTHLKGSYPEEHNQLSLGKLLKGYMTGDWSDADLEMKAMASTPTTAGGILIPPALSARVIDLARNLAAVLRAGAVIVPMTSAKLTMARQTQDVTASWYGEGVAINESDAALEAVEFVARKMGTLVRVSNELLADAQNADAVIEASIAQAMALELDRVGLLGTGVAPEPRGLTNVAGITSIAVNAVPANYDKFLEGIFAVRGSNLEPTAALYSTRTAQTLATLKTGIAGDKTSLVPPTDFAALQKFTTNQIPNTLGGAPPANVDSLAVIGAFSELMIGLRAAIQIEVSRDAGDAFAKDQTMIRATWRGDVQVARPKGFAVLTGIKA